MYGTDASTAATRLHCVLGDPALLDEATDPSRRVVVVEDGRVAALGCFAVAYGPYAEISVALRDPAADALAHEVVALLAERARALHVSAIQASVSPAQAALAGSVPGGVLRDRRLVVRSVPTQ